MIHYDKYYYIENTVKKIPNKGFMGTQETPWDGLYVSNIYIGIHGPWSS